jgi:type I restriction enzyme M protein
VERVKVEYDAPDVIFDRIASLQEEINKAMAEFKEKCLE